MQKKKVLFVATVVKTHMMQFHIPYLKMFQEMGWETAVASRNDYENPEDCRIPYCDHYFDIPGITPDALNDNYRIVVKHGEESILTMEYSPFTYIARKLADNTASEELKNVVTAMYRYNKAAEAYVAQPAE